MNMSHCRFHNTVGDLADCQGALEELINDPNQDSKLSSMELDAAKRLVGMCLEIVSQFADRAGVDMEELHDSHIEEELDKANAEAESHEPDEEEEG